MHTAIRTPRRALTVVEVLVVIATVGLLLALALPALGRLGIASRSTACSANLRQLGTAAASYSTVHDGRFPAAILYFATPGGVRTEAWDATVLPGGAVAAGPLSPFLERVDGIRQCPEHHGPSNFGNDQFSGYNYNTSFIGAEGAFPSLDQDGTVIDGWRAARLGVPPALHRRPSETALFADAGFVGGANRFMRAPGNTVEINLGLIYAGGQAFRHGGGCNVVHLDGHCSTCVHPRAGVHASASLLENVLGFPRNGFLSDEDDAYDPR